MVSSKARSVYQKTEAQADIDPVKLIHLMYERALIHLELAEKAIKEKNPRARGENLGKAIAIVTELLASVKEGDDSEVAGFLRGLYTAILVELPKVSTNNDLIILRRAHGYIAKLKEIWEQGVMSRHGSPKEAHHDNEEQLREVAGLGKPPSDLTHEKRSVSVAI